MVFQAPPEAVPTYMVSGLESRNGEVVNAAADAGGSDRTPGEVAEDWVFGESGWGLCGNGRVRGDLPFRKWKGSANANQESSK